MPWFDWALLAVLAIWFFFSPEAIPILLYHLTCQEPKPNGGFTGDLQDFANALLAQFMPPDHLGNQYAIHFPPDELNKLPAHRC